MKPDYERQFEVIREKAKDGDSTMALIDALEVVAGELHDLNVVGSELLRGKGPLAELESRIEALEEADDE